MNSVKAALMTTCQKQMARLEHSCVNLRFYTTLVVWNLRVTRKSPISENADFCFPPCKPCLVSISVSQLSNGLGPSRKIILHRKYFRYPCKTGTIVFTMHSATKRAKFHFSSTIIGRDSLFMYVIYSSDGR